MNRAPMEFTRPIRGQFNETEDSQNFKFGGDDTATSRLRVKPLYFRTPVTIYLGEYNYLEKRL